MIKLIKKIFSKSIEKVLIDLENIEDREKNILDLKHKNNIKIEEKFDKSSERIKKLRESIQNTKQ